MDLHASFAVLLLSIAGLCLCQTVTQLDEPLNETVGESTLFKLINPPPLPPEYIVWRFAGQREVVIITWRNGVAVPHTDYASRITLDNTTASLELRGLTVSDTGEYTVNFTSSGVQQLETTSLHVFEKIVISPIISTEGTLTAGNSSVNLTCDALGTIVTRKWTKDGQPLSPSNGVTFYEENRILSISTVEREDSGLYECTVSNPISSVSETYRLVVNYGPVNITITGTKAVDAGNLIHLTCTTESVPESRYTWTVNGKESPGASYIKEQSGTEDSGIYTCTAWNSITNLSQKAHVDVSVTDKKEVALLSVGAIAGIAVACLALGVVVGVGASCLVVTRRIPSENGTKSLCSSGVPDETSLSPRPPTPPERLLPAHDPEQTYDMVIENPTSRATSRGGNIYVNTGPNQNRR